MVYHKIGLGLGIGIGVAILVVIIIVLTQGCQSNCTGNSCGVPNGCGGTCECSQGGLCQNNKCCYPNCDGISCGDDGCGGTCECKQARGVYQKGVCQSNKRCCYPKIGDKYFCGDDGCGGTNSCNVGSECAPSGICVSRGVQGWTYLPKYIEDQVSSNADDASSCAAWNPDPTKMYPYWVFDEKENPNCVKYSQNSKLCGIQKASATSFNVLTDEGPEKEPCKGCSLNVKCQPGQCCPKDWVRKSSDSSYCLNSYGTPECCLDVGSDKNDCDQNLKNCKDLQNIWWQSFPNQIDGQCSSAKGVINFEGDLSLFSDACKGKSVGDRCRYISNSGSFDGFCQNCTEQNEPVCLPPSVCVATSPILDPTQQGQCLNICG